MDNVNENIQNSEVNSASMHDIPLSNEDQDEQVQGPIEKIPSKSGSLKRFFKLSSNKKGANESGANSKNSETDAGTEADNEDDENDKQLTIKQVNEKNKEMANDTNSDQTATKSQDLRRERSHRFNFRFSNNAAEGDVPTSSNNAPSASKHSLRSSLSTYFNSVFKRKQAVGSKHTLRTLKKKENEQDDDQEKSIEMVEHKFVGADEKKKVVSSQAIERIDQLHNLNASEENKESAVAAATPLSNAKAQI